jgi:hypothetical protein
MFHWYDSGSDFLGKGDLQRLQNCDRLLSMEGFLKVDAQGD